MTIKKALSNVYCITYAYCYCLAKFLVRHEEEIEGAIIGLLAMYFFVIALLILG